MNALVYRTSAAAIVACALGAVVFPVSGTRAATLDVTCDGALPDLDVPLPSPLPDITLQLSDDVCFDIHMEEVNEAVNAHHDKIEALEDNVSLQGS